MTYINSFQGACDAASPPVQAETLQSGRNDNPPALADFGDWVGAIVFIVITAASLLNQALQKTGKPARPARRPGAPPSDAADEIRKFLERAAQQQRQKQKERPPLTEARTDTRDVILTAEPVPTTDDIALGGSVSEHVQRHLGSDHRAPITSKVSSADEQLEFHLHDVFDHRLGKISREELVPIEQGTDAKSMRPEEETKPADPRNLAREIALSMKNPASVRQAVIISEILRRRDGIY